MAVNHRTEIRLELNKLLYHQLVTSLPVVLLLASVIVFSLLGHVQKDWLLIWYGLFILSLAIRSAVAIWFYRTKHNIELLKLHETVFVLSSTMVAIFWGVLGSILMPSDIAHQLLVIIFIAGIASGALVSLMPSYVASFLYVTAALIPIVIWDVSRDHAMVPNGFAIGVTAYWLFLVTVGWRGYKFTVKNIKLAMENKDLLKELYATNEELNITNQNLYESEARFHQSFDYAAIGMALVSLEGDFVKVNLSFCHILGYSEEELLKMNCQMITHPDDLAIDLAYVKPLIEGTTSNYQVEERYLRKNKDIVWILLTKSVVRDRDHRSLYLIAQIQDITKQKQAEWQLLYQAHHDLLTQLPNRYQLKVDMARIISSAKRYRRMFAILYLDLDNFKEINDNEGHDMGDGVLSALANRLKESVRQEDAIARIGGDEFVMVISEFSDSQGVVSIVERILNRIAEPLTIGGHSFNLEASLGISLYPNDGDDFDVLLKKADIALYQVKDAGKGGYRFYRDEG